MKILVTGGCGFIGKALVKQLLLNGNAVDVIDNLYIGKEATNVDGATFLGGDIRAMENIPNKKYDLIYHLAAYSRVLSSYEHNDLTFSVNVMGTKNVLDYAVRNKCKVIFTSSSSIHHSISPYASSKSMGEELCNFYRIAYDVPVTIVRLYNVYGPGELVDSHMAAVIGKWRKQIRDGKSITINNNGLHKKAFTYIDDVVDGLIRLIDTDQYNFNGWEMGNTTTYSINELFEMFVNKFGKIETIDKHYSLGGWQNGERKNNEVERLGWYPKDRLKEYINSL
jgi:UDP-glucose 4-epimerase